MTLTRPALSPEARDIYEHLTPEEKRRPRFHAIWYGVEAGLVITMPELAAAFIYFSLPIGIALLAAAIAYCYAIGWPRVRTEPQRIRELLCATKYACEHGYQPDRLNLCASPISE